MSKNEDGESALNKSLADLSISHCPNQDFVFFCDLQYGFPKERRPRREKIGAIAKQLTNFLDWQTKKRNIGRKSALLTLVHLEQDEDAIAEIMIRLNQNDSNVSDDESPTAIKSAISSTSKPLERVVADIPGVVVYLSPDADEILQSDALKSDGLSGLIIGGIIDRKHIQENRSLTRSEELGIPALRWPMPGDWNQHEPLNVDCILEGMQDWLWTRNLNESIANALASHVKRHPGRPKHKR